MLTDFKKNNGYYELIYSFYLNNFEYKLNPKEAKIAKVEGMD